MYFIKVNKNAQMPCKRDDDAGYDIRYCGLETLYIHPNEVEKIATGFKLWIKDKNIVGLIFPRSSTGTKGLNLANTTGVIDSSYQGEWIIALKNTSSEDIVIKPNDKIAQVVFVQLGKISIKEVEEFPAVTSRNIGGFGSTGRS